MSKRIIYIMNSSPFESNAVSNRILAEVKGFIENDIVVEFISLDLKKKGSDQHLIIKAPSETNLYVKFYFSKSSYILINKILRRLAPICMFFDLLFRKNNIIVYHYGHTARLVYGLSVLKKLKRNRLLLLREITEYPKFIQQSAKICFIRRFYLRQLLGSCDIVLVISRALQRFARELTNKPVIIVNMIVDPERFRGISPDRENIVSYTGSLDDSKDGITNMLRSFSMFLSKQSDTFVLKLYGKAKNESELLRINQTIENLGLDSFVHLEGHVERDVLPGLLAKSRLLVLCRPDNKQAEGGFPTKLGEYLATGVPVVVTNVGEIGLFIKDSVNGFVSESDDPDIFSDKMIEALLAHDDVGLNGKKLIDYEFNPKAQIMKVIDVFRPS